MGNVLWPSPRPAITDHKVKSLSLPFQQEHCDTLFFIKVEIAAMIIPPTLYSCIGISTRMPKSLPAPVPLLSPRASGIIDTEMHLPSGRPGIVFEIHDHFNANSMAMCSSSMVTCQYIRSVLGAVRTPTVVRSQPDPCLRT